MTTRTLAKLARPLITGLSAAAVISVGPIGAEPAHAAACSPTITTTAGSTKVAFNTVGTCDWTVPAGIYSVDALIVGGGGGGGGGGNNTAGSGGGGGQVQVLSTLSVTPGQVPHGIPTPQDLATNATDDGSRMIVTIPRLLARV